MKIALTMISRGIGQEVPNLKRCLKSIAPFVDDIFITLTSPSNMTWEAEKMLKEFNAHISYGDFRIKADEEMVKWVTDFLGYTPTIKVGTKMFQFDEARNFSYAQVPKEYDWILWLDSDDVFLGGEKLKSVLKLGDEKKIEGFYFDYLYQVDVQEDPALPPEQWKIRNIVIQHLRERLTRNTGKFKWIAPIHETLIEQVPTNKSDNYDCAVMHLATNEDRVNSLTRNLPNLELAVYQSKGKDPRHLYYLAKAYVDIRTTDTDKKAIPLMLAYLYGEHKSGWPQERAQACDYLAELYRRNGELNNAIKAVMNGFMEEPNDPMLYLSLAQSYVVKKDYEKALFWTKIADSIPTRKGTLVQNPKEREGLKHEIIYVCSAAMGKVDEAWAAAFKMYELSPDNPNIRQIYENASALREQREVSRVIVTLADYLKKTGEYHKLKPLIQAVPRISEQVPAVIDLRNKNFPPKIWGKDEIAIYCGAQFTNWTPDSLKDGNAFVGGSEIAVVRMAEELTKLNWKVTVYADPQEEGDYNGVKYLPYYKANILDMFNILIVWRQLGAIDSPLKAKKIYFWAHDILNGLDFTEERIKKITKFIVLSKYHRSNIEHVPDSKIFLSSNGVD